MTVTARLTCSSRRRRRWWAAWARWQQGWWCRATNHSSSRTAPSRPPTPPSQTWSVEKRSRGFVSSAHALDILQRHSLRCVNGKDLTALDSCGDHLHNWPRCCIKRLQEPHFFFRSAGSECKLVSWQKLSKSINVLSLILHCIIRSVLCRSSAQLIVRQYHFLQKWDKSSRRGITQRRGYGIKLGHN